MNSKKFFIPATLISLLLNTTAFAATIVFHSKTADKDLDGSYEIHKTNANTWSTKDGSMSGHKVKSVKQSSLLPGVKTYEGIQKIERPGKKAVTIHFLGQIHDEKHEHGSYVKLDEKNHVIGHGHYDYEYDKK